jgi:LacI family transcriptional regulator
MKIAKMKARRPRVAIFLHALGPYFDQLQQGIAAYHQLHGPWEFLHEQFGMNPNKKPQLREVDGVIVSLGSGRDPAAYQRLLRAIERAGKPVVDITPHRFDLPFPQVCVDDAAVGRAAAEHLLALGFSNFGFVGIPYSFSHERHQGFSSVLASRGLSCLIPPANGAWWDTPKQLALWGPWFRSVPKPIAIFAAFDLLAASIMVAAQEKGILVPDQMAFMGVDNGSACDLFRPSITSVPLDGVRTGFEGARLLHEMMEGSPAPRSSILIPPLSVIPRGSTDSMVIDDMDVIAAVRYIRDHAASPISTPEIVQHVAVSRRKLEKQFKAALQRTIGDEVRRVHTNRAMELLRGTRLTLEDVAEKSGFGSGAAFTRIFTRVAGSSPSRYRRQAVAQAAQAPPHRDAMPYLRRLTSPANS